jgi:acetone carboxylase gamma subunit
MNTQTENPKGIEQISVQDLLRPFEKDYEKEQLRDQVAMLQEEVDKQDKIIKLLAEALFLTYGVK